MRLIEDKEGNSLRVVNAMRIKEEWDKFVFNHPSGNIFQTSYMAEVFERTKRIEPITLAVIDEENNEIVASLLAYVWKQVDGFLSSFMSRARIRGGPLFSGNEKGIAATSLLMQSYDNIIRKKALYTDIWNLGRTQQLSTPLEKNGYVYEDLLNFLVDLTKSKEELWAGLSKSRRRYIRKSREKGVTVEEIKNRNFIPIFYDLLRQTYKNVKIPLVDISLFESAFDILVPKNMLKIFLAKYSDEYIGGIMCPMYKGVIYEWYVCGSRAHSKLYSSEMVTWHPIEWGSENGYHTFDFLGAGKPDEEYGVREFKKQFGGQLVNFGRYKRIHSPKKLWLAEKGFEVWRRIK